MRASSSMLGEDLEAGWESIAESQNRNLWRSDSVKGEENSG